MENKEKMKKIEFKKIGLIILFLLIFLPTFWRMLRPGIFSMQDWQFFRLYEFDKCVSDLQIPCRWAPDIDYQYGQPIFNFYGQFSFAIGEVFHLLGLSLIDTTKALFIFSLIGSAFTMFLLSSSFWRSRWAGFISALIYVYAPYRAVDVYVRGALPEAMAFVFFPLIIYFFNKFVEEKKTNFLIGFSLSFAGLIITHNLSALMFVFFLIPWGIYFLTKEKSWFLWKNFLFSGFLIAGLSAFYLLPAVFESQFISLSNTTEGYFNFHNHFATLNELLISRFWGYGASNWGKKDLSVSVGHIQWILPLLILGYFFVKKSLKEHSQFLFIFFLGWGMLLLTHNKTTWIWEQLTFLQYIQFPWRFLSMAVLAFSLASGIVIILINKNMIKFGLTAVVAALLIGLNTPFFFEDLWYKISDKEFFSGIWFSREIAASPADYWPIFAKDIPTKKADKNVDIISGQGNGFLIERRSNYQKYQLLVNSASAVVQFSTVYFPGWKAFWNNKEINIYPSGNLGLITANLLQGNNIVELKFMDTPIRKLGNYLTLLSFIGILLFFIQSKLKLFKKL